MVDDKWDTAKCQNSTMSKMQKYQNTKTPKRRKSGFEFLNWSPLAMICVTWRHQDAASLLGLLLKMAAVLDAGQPHSFGLLHGAKLRDPGT